jgi:UDP-N-acetylmuramate--alanine ligase
VFAGERRLGEITLPIPGAYNADNAAGAIAVLMGAYDLPFETIRRRSIRTGGSRTASPCAVPAAMTLVKDYISHPTGMRRVLQSARKMPHRRIWGVFKPYRFTLMRYHGDEYARSSGTPTRWSSPPCTPPRSAPSTVSTRPGSWNCCGRAATRCTSCPRTRRRARFLSSRVEPGDMVIFFGGDDFFRMADAWADGLDAAAGTGEGAR